MFSPREWGCFHFAIPKKGGENVFPTRVGVFLAMLPTRWQPGCFPHASGGVSR